MKLRTIAAMVLVPVLVAPLVSCGGGSGPPPFQGGIYLHTTIFDSRFNQPVDQMGVGVTGQLSSADSGSCSPNGITQIFGGTTNKFGVYECTSCQVHAVWNLTVNYNLVNGACQPSLQQIPIDFPCGGAIQPFQCIL
jgi:hypothetical protein